MVSDQGAENTIPEDIMEDIAAEMQDDEIEENELVAEEDAVEQDVVEVAEETSENDDNVEGTVLEPLDQEGQLCVLEAILFASSEPLAPKVLHERLPDDADLNVLLPALQEQYQGRGVELVEIDGHWAFRTAQEIAKVLTIEKEVSKKMSRAMLETMAIIAYHQPLTRAEIENIRGVATHRGTLDTLMEMEWVKPGRRRETPGRPLTWVTTMKFLDHFQLEALNDLPGLEDLKASGLLDKRPAIDTIPDTGDLFDSADEDAEEMLEAQERQEQMDADDNFIEPISNDMISGSSEEDDDEEEL